MKKSIAMSCFLSPLLSFAQATVARDSIQKNTVENLKFSSKGCVLELSLYQTHIVQSDKKGSASVAPFYNGKQFGVGMVIDLR